MLKKMILPAIIGMCFCSETQARPQSDKAILLVAFGTSIPRAKKAYENIDRLVKKEFKGVPVYWAYTSSFIRRKLAKQGSKTDSVTEALDKMKQKGIKQVAIQSLHIVNGSEYEEMIKAVEAFKNSFDKINIGMPMLISALDLKKISDALKSVIPAERNKNDAVVLMGHGNHHGIGDMAYIAASHELNRKDSKIFVGTVEGRPSFDEVRAALKKSGAKKAYLIPMMVVAGDHALNDLAGAEKDSWKNILEKDGIKCVPVLKGLGENDSMAAIFVGHLKKAMK